MELPKNWTFDFELTPQFPTLKLNNPEGKIFNGVEEAIAHLMQQNCAPPNESVCSDRQRKRRRSYSTSSLLDASTPVDSHDFGWFLRSTDRMHFDTRAQKSSQETGPLEGAVEYLRDSSLPTAWSVRTIRSKSLDLEVLYQSKEHKFNDKVSVAEFLEGMGHPALEVEQLLLNLPRIAHAVPRRQQYEGEDESSNTTYATIILSQSSVEEVGKDPQLAKTVAPCYIDLVKLPDIFLKYKTVSVEEQDQVMTIRDALTNAFIAKKIIYD